VSPVVSPGDPVGLLVQTSKGPESWQAICAGISPRAVALTAPDRPLPKDLADVILVVGTPGRRSFTHATYIRLHGGAQVFRLNGEWRAFDGRASKRFATNIPAQVTSVLGGSRQTGRVLDVSLGGAAVQVESKPGGRDLELSLQSDGYAARLPASLVRHEQRRGHVLLHLQFSRLTLVQQAFVRNLVERLEAIEQGQRAAS
jgi:hypothetical protein